MQSDIISKWVLHHCTYNQNCDNFFSLIDLLVTLNNDLAHEHGMEGYSVTLACI